MSEELHQPIMMPRDNATPIALRLARECSLKDQYRHHLLLRLLDAREDLGDARAAYIDAMTPDLGVGHPWELIAMYRGLLIEEHEAAVQCFHAGVDIALAERHGPTLWAIAAMIATVGWVATGRQDLRERGRQLLAHSYQGRPLVEVLPATADMFATWSSILDQDAPPKEAVDVALQVMPFNYR